MKKKVLLCLIVILILSFSLSLFAACNKDKNPSGDNNEGTTAPSIAEILSDGKTDTEYTVEGVVFGKKNGGFIISDGTNAIFIESNENVAAGDKVSVKGTLKLNTEKAPVLGNAQVTVSANGQTVVSPVKGLLTDVTKLAATRKNFYKYVEATGFVRFNAETSVYTLESGSSRVIIDANGRDADFEEHVDEKVTMSFVNIGFTTSWKVLYLGDVQKFEVNLAEVKDAIFESVGKQLPEEVYVGIELPVNYADEPDVTFTWSVVTADAPITIVDNEANVSEVSEDATVTIKLTLTAPESQTAEKTFEILVKKATNVAIADIAAYEGTDVIVFSGTVYAKGYSQTKDRTALMVSDGANHYTAVDIAKTDFFKYTVGDKVKVAGTKAVVVDVNTVSADSIIVTEAAPDDFTIDFESLDYTELKTDDATTYTGLVDNYLANTNKLYKITTPFMVSSGNTSSNFIRFGHDVNAGNGYEYKVGEETKKRYFVFSRNTMDDTVSWLQNELDVPNLADKAAKYEGYTFYAFAMFSSAETWQFVLPGEFAVAVDREYLADKELSDKMAVNDIVVAKEAGSIDLPKTLKYGGEVTWTQDKDVFDLDTGAYAAATEDVLVTLTASYTVNGKEVVKEFKVTVLSKDVEYISVTEALAKEDGVITAVKGTIVSFVSNTGTGIPGGAQKGVIISDGKNIMIIGDEFERNAGETDFDKYYVLDEHKLEIGDTLYVFNGEKKGVKFSVKNAKTVELGPKDEITWDPVVAKTITSQAELAEFTKSENHNNVIVKFVATEENPIYLGGSSKTYDSLNLKLYFTVDKFDNKGVMVNGKTVVTKARASEFVLGTTWWKTLNPNMSNAWIGSNNSYPFKGEFYAICTTDTGTYYQMAILAPGFNLTAILPSSAE